MERIMGNKIYIRPITLDDTDWIVRLRNSKFVQGYFIWRDLLTCDMHRNWMKSKVFTGEVVQYVICEMDATPIGSVYYRDIDHATSSAEIGIFIDEKYVGLGYGSDAMDIFIKLGFEHMKLHTINLRVVDSNGRARHVYERMGFTKVREEVAKSQPAGEELTVVFMKLQSQNNYLWCSIGGANTSFKATSIIYVPFRAFAPGMTPHAWRCAA